MQLLEQVIGESHGLCEYEDALHLLVSRQHVEAVTIQQVFAFLNDFVHGSARCLDRRGRVKLRRCPAVMNLLRLTFQTDAVDFR